MKHVLLMVLLGAIWGASFLFMRMSVTEFGPIPLIQVRAGVGALVLVLWAILQGKRAELFWHPAKMGIVGLTNSALPFTLFAIGTQLLSAGFASVLNSTTPFFGALIAVFFLRERLAARKWLGLAIGFAGVCVLVAGNRAIEGTVLGAAACLLATCSYAVAAHYARRQLSSSSPIVVAASSSVMASLMLVPLSIATWPEVSPSLNSWLAAIALGVVCTGVALAIYFHLLSVIGATRAISVAYLIPLFGVLWGAIFLGEQLTIWSIAGGGLILAGLWTITSQRQ